MTDQPKWTKGPWALLVEQSYRPECTVATIEQAGEDLPYRGMIARLQSAEHIDGIDGAELTANAHLIAAAPDLYAELVSLMAAYAECNGECHPAYGRAEYALAKARGETK